ncbi:MAG: hypothetical protein WA885_09190 [Phormidesmis sp.]
MHQLSPFTCRRLSQLPRLTSVWECDRRPLTAANYAASHGISPGSEASSKGSQSKGSQHKGSQGDCIIWVDSLQGVVRGLSVVPEETGHEAIVRALLQAIEAPQGGVEPARPRKVVVCDREIQFFLRGALQDLDIPVEHAPALPILDEVFQKLQTPDVPQIKLPAAFEKPLLAKAELLWQDAPWNAFSEQEILAIELNCWEVETLYLSVLGLAGMEYGLLFYRDLESLRQFRHKLLNSEDFSDGMQQAFLEQNCLFINFNPVDADSAAPTALSFAPMHLVTDGAVEYEFGSLHPLEGLRSQLAEEEAVSLIVALEALHRFFKKHDIGAEDFALKPLTSRFRIPNPVKGSANRLAAETIEAITATETADILTVKISTVPEVSSAFLEETNSAIEPLEASDTDLAPLIDDSVPEGSLIMLGSYADKQVAPLRETPRIYYQSFLTLPERLPSARSLWPVLTIQTTRPKAQQLVRRLQQEGGVRSICFNSGSDPLSGQIFQVGLLQTLQGSLHLFNEYETSDPADHHSLEKWAKESAQNHHCCGCIIATGATGTKRGRPTLKEVIAFFEVMARPPEALGLAPLVMSYGE